MMPRQHIETILNMSDPQTKRQLMVSIGTLQGIYGVDLKPVSPKRSNQANRFYWGAVVQSLETFLRDQGEFLTKEQCHQLIGAKLLRQTVMNPTTGEVLGEVIAHTSQMDTEQFSEFVNNAIDWLADTFGIAIPSPEMFKTSNTAEAVERTK